MAVTAAGQALVALCERVVGSLAQPCEINTTITPILQVRKLRLREIN